MNGHKHIQAQSRKRQKEMLTMFQYGEQTQNISGEDIFLSFPSLQIRTHGCYAPLRTDELIHRHHFLMDSQMRILI